MDRFGYREGVLALLVAANFGQLGARFLLSPVVPDVIGAFDSSKAAVGAALTGMWAAYALAQYPSGVLADRFGERPVLVAALAGTGAGSLAIAAAPSFLGFAAAVVLLGVGAGLFFAVAASLLSELYDRRGRALGFLTAGGAVAGVVAPVAAAAVAPAYGWRAAVALGAVTALPLLVALRLLVRPTPGSGEPLRERFDLARAGAVVARPPVAFSVVVAAAFGFTFQSLASFLPTFLVQHRGLSDPSAGVALGAVFALSALAQPAVGRLSDAVGRDAALAASALVTGAAVAALVVGAPPALGVLVLGVGVSWPGVVQARFMDHLPETDRGTAFGAVRTVYMFLSAAGSAVTGAVADAFGWPAAFGLIVALLGMATLALGANRGLGLDL